MTKKSRPRAKGKAKSGTWSLLQNKLFTVFILLLPVQLGLHFWPDWALVSGIRVDYLAPAIYLTDLVVIGLLIVSFKDLKKINLFSLIAVGIFALLNIYFPLSIAVIYSDTIAIAQFFLGRTIGGIFYLLGERSFGINTPGIALVNIMGKWFLRPYGTFGHPNALAGFLGVSLIFLYYSKKNTIQKIAIVLGAITLLLTFSQNAWLSLILAIMLFKFRKIVFSLVIFLSILFPIVSKIILAKFNFGQSIAQRLELAYLAGMVFSKVALIGVGAGNFVTALPKLIYANNFNWLLQPVHNIFLLILTETGIIGLLLFFYLLTKTIRETSPALLFILFTGLLDHYWLTQQQNLLLLGVVIGLCVTHKDNIKR